MDSESPVRFFIHYLKNLAAMVGRVEKAGVESSDLLQARLAGDMFPLAQQVSTAVSFSLRAVCPLVGLDIPDLGDAKSCTDLRRTIGAAIECLQQIEAEAFAGFERKTVRTRAGFADLSFTGGDYLRLYAQPNFLFHYSMAYAILRANGVALGKQDFDGFHTYPEGFSFPGQ